MALIPVSAKERIRGVRVAVAAAEIGREGGGGGEQEEEQERVRGETQE